MLQTLKVIYQLGMFPMYPTCMMFLRATNFNSDISAFYCIKYYEYVAYVSRMLKFCCKSIRMERIKCFSDMSQMFDDATNFNGDISGWDVSNVIDMEEMFLDAQNFNQNISFGWNVSLVVNMDNMFLNT